MAKVKKSKSIPKQTTLTKKLDKVSKPKQVNRKRSQSWPPTRKSLCNLKHAEKKENLMEIVEEEVSPQVYFGTNSPILQSIILCHILSNNLSLFEQIEIRRVCRLWHYNVEDIWNKSRSLVLTLKGHSIEKPKLSSDSHEPNLKFEYEHFDSPTMVKGVELAIGTNHWNRPTIDLLGDLFRDIEHLTIYYELSCETHTTDNLDYFLQKFTKIKSFSLIMPPEGNVAKDFLSRLFKILNDHLVLLDTLHVHLPYFSHPFPVLRNDHFRKILPKLQNFSLNCTVWNLAKILHSMGKSLPASQPMQSLSINVEHQIEKSLTPVSNLFKQNPKLSQIKRLELTGLVHWYIESFGLVNSLLDHFTQLECLHLCQCPFEGYSKRPKLTNKWIQALAKLPHLKELLHWEFDFKIYQDLKEVKPLPTIRKLTVVAADNFFDRIEHNYRTINQIEYPERTQPRLMFGQFLQSFSKQFPKLEQLTFRRKEPLYENEKDFSNWCFAEIVHLKSLKLIDYSEELIFTA